MANNLYRIEVQSSLESKQIADGSCMVLSNSGLVFATVHQVDAVEVVHSAWVLNDDGSGTCKHCHITTKNCWDYDNWMNYCPNCGARMYGGEIDV